MIAAEAMTAEELAAVERLFSEPKDEPADSSGDTRDLPPAPTWPMGILPTEVEHYAQQQAAAIGVPVEMVSVPLLVFAGSTIGNAVELQTKRSWRELPSLWAGVVSDPGTAKSPALRAAQRPIDVLQKRMHELWQAEMAEFEIDLQAWESTAKEDRDVRPQPPKMDHLYTSDITIEALVSYLDYCPGLAIIHDELAGFISSMDKYRKGGNDRQQYLSLWAGAPVKADRRGGGTTYAVHPVTGVYGGIQPDYAASLHNAEGKRDGMVERFLLFRPDVEPSYWTDDDIDLALLDSISERFEALRTIAQRCNEGERVTVQFHSEAKAIWVSWHNDVTDIIRASRGLRNGFYSKIRGQVARIALILHCLHNVEDPRVMLSAATMRAAIQVGEFFCSHLDRVLPLLGDSGNGEPVGLPARILRYLRCPELQSADGWVRRSDLTRRLGNVNASALSDELEALEGQQVIERRKVKTTTKPAWEWRISPAPQAGEEVRL